MLNAPEMKINHVKCYLNQLKSCKMLLKLNRIMLITAKLNKIMLYAT